MVWKHHNKWPLKYLRKKCKYFKKVVCVRMPSNIVISYTVCSAIRKGKCDILFLIAQNSQYLTTKFLLKHQKWINDLVKMCTVCLYVYVCLCACVCASAGGWVTVSLYNTYTYRCVCMHSCKKPSKRSWRTDRQRAVGIRMHAGSWAVQLVHSVS